jgi:LmbE family N-acetylglucosaminyl deacetylase
VTYDLKGKKTIVGVGAHMDDLWYGMGGLALKAVSNGHRVFFINTVGDYSNWPVTKGRESELKAKVKAFAVDRGIDIRFLHYKYEQVPDDVEIMTKLAEYFDEIRPDIIFLHWHDDTNRDHWKSGVTTLYSGIHRSCFLEREGGYSSEIYAFQLDAQCRSFVPNVYFDITEMLPEVLQVLGAIDRIYAEYNKTDYVRARVEDLITNRKFELTTHSAQKFALSITRGAECGVPYAEAYYAHTRRPVNRLLDI